MEQLAFHWTDFHEVLYLQIILKSAQKVEVSLKSDKNNRYIAYLDLCQFFICFVFLSLYECWSTEAQERKYSR